MASMTDVVFLLLVFFMVTSTFVFPTALEVNLPQSSEQTPLKPVTRVFIQADGSLWGQFGDGEPMAMPSQQALVDFLKGVKEQAPETAIAVFGDSAVPYGDVVEILNLGAANDLKMVLATTKKDNAATAAVNGDRTGCRIGFGLQVRFNHRDKITEHEPSTPHSSLRHRRHSGAGVVMAMPQPSVAVSGQGMASTARPVY